MSDIDLNDYGSENSNNFQEDIKLKALDNLTNLLKNNTGLWLFTNQEADLGDEVQKMIEIYGIENYEDFEDEQVKEIKFGILYAQGENARIIQLPIYFLE